MNDQFDGVGPPLIRGRLLDPDDDGDGRWQAIQASLPGLAIAGGTNEVLRNVIGERVLGLPPEPRADKNVTFRESIAVAAGGSEAPARKEAQRA